MTRVLRQTDLSASVLRPIERLCYAVGASRSPPSNAGPSTRQASLAQPVQLSDSLSAPELQGLLPLNPMGFGAARDDARPGVQHRRQLHHQHQLQNYAGESTLSYLVQMAGLTVQNFTSAAAAWRRRRPDPRFARQQAKAIGNFWVDLVEPRLYPTAALARAALFFCSQGVIQNLKPYTRYHARGQPQTIAQVPCFAGTDKDAGTNGGGFFQTQNRRILRKPDAADQPGPTAVDLRDSGRASPMCSGRWSVTRARAGRSLRHERALPGGVLSSMPPSRPATRFWPSWDYN